MMFSATFTHKNSDVIFLIDFSENIYILAWNFGSPRKNTGLIPPLWSILLLPFFFTPQASDHRPSFLYV